MKRFLLLLLINLLTVYSQAQQLPLIPQASQCTIYEGTYNLPAVLTVSFPEEWQATLEMFKQDLKNRMDISVVFSSKNNALKIQKDASLASEAYELDIHKKGIILKASHVCGLNYALASLQQLLLNSKSLPLLTLKDSPRFSYRGVMVDCSRHFWSISELRQTIDQMSLFKLNRLHLHLTDNQGWRFEVKKYPEIAKKGSYYWDFPALSGKYYTQKQLKELVAYAQNRGIEIIPEIDMPGHMLSLFAAFPEITCLGGEYEAFPQERDGKLRKRTWQNMVCLGNPKTYEVLGDIIAELCDVFPSQYIHLGGDEVATMIWKDCPHCQELFEREHMHDLGELQDYFTRWAHAELAKHGRTMIGWDEINERKAAQDQDVVMIWHSDEETCRKALDRNLNIILSPGDPCYFDYSYAKNPTRKVYEWNPVNHAMGAQANLWTEYVCTQSDVEKMLYPRLCALAEVLWNRPEQKHWPDFYQRLHAFPFQQLGMNAWMEEKESDEWFDLSRAVKPVLPAGVHVETNIYNVKGYEPEYALDGNLATFFQNGWDTNPDEYFKVWYDVPQRLSKIKVICDLSKDYFQRAKLLISEDDSLYTEVGTSDDFGHFEVQLDGRQVKAFKIVPTFVRLSRLVIREIEIE